MSNFSIEPRADIRAAAMELRQFYIALIATEFTEHQALVIIGQVLAANAGNPPAQQ